MGIKKKKKKGWFRGLGYSRNKLDAIDMRWNERLSKKIGLVVDRDQPDLGRSWLFKWIWQAGRSMISALEEI